MMRFCVLGTGAGGAPTLHRAPTAVAVRIEGSAFLFDCGEGTQRQLIRARLSRRKIGLIAISHLHGDHVLGLVPLLASMASDRRREPLLLVGPQGLAQLVRSTLCWIDVQLPFELVIRELEPGFKGELASEEGWRLECAPLQHSVPCFGFRLTARRKPSVDMERLRAFGITPGPLVRQLKQQGWVEKPTGERVRLEDVLLRRHEPVLVYCGDTRPCPEAIELARGADVLLYEATFGEDRAELARQYLHSTAAEAAAVARDAGVRRLVLVHFSTRYRDIEPLVGEARAVFPATEAAQEVRWEEVYPSDALDDDSQPLSDANTERCQPVASIPPVQGTDQRADQPRTAHSQGMS